MEKKGAKKATVRLLAWQCLQEWASGRAFAESLIDQAARKNNISSSERALLQNIVYGCLRHKTWLEHIRLQLRSAPLEESLCVLIATACYQLFLMNQQEYAVVNESVKLAPKRAQGLVNAMLRNALRRKEQLLEERDSLELSTRYSTPEWMVQRWEAELGEDDTRQLLQWIEQTPAIYARVNPLNPPACIPDAWEALPHLPQWYKVKGPLPQAEVKAGQIYITDPSTRYCVDLLAPQKGEKILDCCAAPGGKSVAMIAATAGEIQLLSTDSQEHRLAPLQENLQVAGGKDVQVQEHDWTQACPKEWQGQFDAVLVDAPCSNTGVLQRRVDARWRLSEEEIKRLAQLQICILNQAAQAVKAGGRLVYSTCSIDREENQDNVQVFLQQNPDFCLEEDYLALPHQEQADGAYAARLRKSGAIEIA